VTRSEVLLPDEVRQALTGRPTIGRSDAIFPFLTVDPAGFPHACLLSRAELEPAETEVHAVVFGAKTIANLHRHGRATLVVVGSEAAWYCKLRLARSQSEPDGLVGVVLALESVKRDAAGVTLYPARFKPSRQLARTESWSRTDELLARLRRA
jgi:hypothetical protein